MKQICLKAISVAVKYYPKKKLQHALRVANYAVEIGSLDIRCEDKSDELFVVGILHDLVEDTEYTKDQLYEDFGYSIGDAVMIVTKDKDEEYQEYIQRVLASKNLTAFIVKKADMKDHMTLTDTLTEKLRDKYIPVLHYFL